MADLDDARIKIVKDHMALECIGDWDGVIATFKHPRYELNGGAMLFDGEEAVRGYFAQSRTAFPDQANELISIGVGSDEKILVEFWLTGTHLGPLQFGGKSVPPTGKAFRIAMAASFEFAPGTDKIICERPYFSEAAIAAQLGILL